MSSLPSDITQLSVAEKFDLLDLLWQDIEGHSPTLSEEQSAELDRRVAMYEQDPSAVISWERVRAGLLTK